MAAYEKHTIPDEVMQLCYQRDNNGHCQYPGCELSKENGDRVNLHHIQNEQFGGIEDPSNLITLCDIHHKAMHAEFSAFYSDSESVLNKMNHITRTVISKLRLLIRVDDAYDLKPYLHYLTNNNEFRQGQLSAIRASLSGRDVLLVTPTGSGKSVCYQIPGLLSDKPSLIISPLKALMVDQVRSIWNKLIPATYINGDLGEEEKKRRFKFINKNLYKFIFATPERFYKSKDPETKFLYKQYSYLVVDEAHVIDSWGIAFRPSYRKLGTLHKELGKPPIIALTATASKETQGKILNSLNIPKAKVIVTGFYKRNIEIIKYQADKYEARTKRRSIPKYNYLTQLLKDDAKSKTIIFVPTVKAGDELLDRMKGDGYQVEFYHSNLDTKAKMDIQSRFTDISKPNLQLLISTSAFGMGIDIPNIRRIIHWSPALSLTEYTQQIGRAGRDGKLSQAYLLTDYHDEGLLKFIATRSIYQSNFQEIHGYTDEEVKIVEQQLNKQVKDMMHIFDIPNGMEWEYIKYYFGEVSLNFWGRYGLAISNILAVGLIAYFILYIILSNQ